MQQLVCQTCYNCPDGLVFEEKELQYMTTPIPTADDEKIVPKDDGFLEQQPTPHSGNDANVLLGEGILEQQP
jgi:hypothetical protein